MSTSLGTATVKLGADVSDLKSGISSAKSEIASIADVAGETSHNFVSSIGGMVGGLINFGSKIGMTVIGLQGLYQGVVGFGKALIGGNASMEQTTVAFKQLLGSSAAANAELKDLQQFAASTPFQFPELADATQHLLAFQFPLKETRPLITAIGDALSALGKNTPADLEQVINVFGQMNAAGKIQTQDLMQLTSVGINGFQILADQMHKPVSVIREMVTKGLIPAKDGIDMLRAGMEKTFGGGMQAQANTFNGLLSTFQDNIGAAWRTFTGPLFDKAKEGLQKLGDLVSSKSFQDFAKMMGDKVGGAIKYVSEVIGQVVKAFQSPEFAELGQTIRELVAPAFQKAGEIISNIFKPAIDSVSGSNISNISTGLRQAASAVDDFIHGLEGFQSSSSGFEQAGTSIHDAAMQVWSVLQDIGGFLSFAFTPVWDQLVSTWQNQVVPAFDDLASTFQMLAPTLVPFSEAIGTVLVGALMFLVMVVADVTSRIVGMFGGLVQFFSGFVQAMLGQVAIFADLFSGNWDKLATDLHGTWNGILDMIKGGLNFINSLTGGMLSKLVGLFGGNFDQIMGKSKDLKDGVSNDFTSMKNNAVQAMTDMQKKTIEKGADISTGVQALFDTLKQQSSSTFGQMSDDAYSYLQSVEDYVSQAQAKALAHQIGSGGSNILNKNFGGYAEGGDVPKTDYYKVGERGPEIVQLQAGSHVYPHGVYPSSMPVAAPLQGSSGSSVKQEIHVHLYMNGREMAYEMIDDIGNALVDRIRAEGPVAA
jgi:tape measure domain-containing protein